MKTRWLMALLVLCLLLAYYTMGNAYLKQEQQSASLRGRIAEASRALDLVPGPAVGAEQRLAAAQAGLAATEGGFPGRVNSTVAIDAILRLAESTGVKAMPLVTRPWEAEKWGGHDYYVLRLSVSAEGDFTRLAAFSRALESGDFPTLVIEQLGVSSEAGYPAAAAGSGAAPVSASFDLAIYTLPPPAD